MQTMGAIDLAIAKSVAHAAVATIGYEAWADLASIDD
jgi:hypothetical protein